MEWVVPGCLDIRCPQCDWRISLALVSDWMWLPTKCPKCGKQPLAAKAVPMKLGEVQVPMQSTNTQ